MPRVVLKRATANVVRSKPVTVEYPREWIRPCLASEMVGQVPTGACWVREIKFDGNRTQIHLREGRAVLYSRNGHDCEPAERLSRPPCSFLRVRPSRCGSFGRGSTWNADPLGNCELAHLFAAAASIPIERRAESMGLCRNVVAYSLVRRGSDFPCRGET